MKSRKQFNGILIFLIITSVFIVSCSSTELTRSKAEQLIKEKFQYPQEMPYHLVKTRAAAGNQQPYASYITFYTNYFNRLQGQGVITYTTDLSLHPGFTTFIAQFTAKGKPFVLDKKEVYTNPGSGIPGDSAGAWDEYFNVKTGSFIFDKITGIVEQKGSNTAIVEYTEKVNLTPFGQISNEQQSINRTIQFTKYDDGWRINQ